MAGPVKLPEGFVLDPPAPRLPEGFVLDRQSSAPALPQGFVLDPPKPATNRQKTEAERLRDATTLRSRLELERERARTDPSVSAPSKIPARLAVGAVEAGPPILKQGAAELGVQAVSFPDRVRTSLANALTAFQSVHGVDRVVEALRPERPELDSKKSTGNLWQFYNRYKDSNPDLAERFRNRALEIEGENLIVERVNKSKMDPTQKALVKLRRIADDAREGVALAQQQGQQIGGGVEGDVAESLGTTFTVSLPAIPAAAAGGVVGAGVRASAAVSGLISGGIMASEAKEHLMSQGVPVEEAERRAFAPAVIGGVVTAGLTRAFGATGIESIGNTQVYSGVRNALRQVTRQFAAEATEEAIDETAQIATRAISFDPDILKRPEELAFTIGMAALSGGFMGGGVGVVGQAGGAASKPVQNVVQRAWDEVVANNEQANFEAASQRYADTLAKVLMDPEFATVGRPETRNVPGRAEQSDFVTSIVEAIENPQIEIGGFGIGVEPGTRSFTGPSEADVAAARTKRPSRAVAPDLPDREFVQPQRREPVFVAQLRPGIEPVTRNVRETVRPEQPPQQETLEERYDQLRGKPRFLWSADDILLERQYQQAQQAQPPQPDAIPQGPDQGVLRQGEIQEAEAGVQEDAPQPQRTQRLTDEEKRGVQAELDELLGFTQEQADAAEKVALQRNENQIEAGQQSFTVEGGQRVEAPTIGEGLVDRLTRAFEKIGGISESAANAAIAELEARVQSANSQELRKRVVLASIEDAVAPKNPTIDVDAKHTEPISDTPFDMDVSIRGETETQKRNRGTSQTFTPIDEDFNPRNNSDVGLLAAGLAQKARAKGMDSGVVDPSMDAKARKALENKQKGRGASVSHIVVSELMPDGSRVARVYTALTKASNQIGKGETPINIVIDPAAKRAVRILNSYTMDLKKFLREKGKKRRVIATFKTRRRHKYYTVPGTNRNRLSDAELDNLVQTGMDFIREQRSGEELAEAQRALIADDLKTTRGEEASYNHETGEITLGDLQSMADQLKAAMTDISGIQSDLSHDWVASTDVGIMMRNPLWTGIASMFWDGMEALRIFEKSRLRGMTPHDVLVDLMTNKDSDIAELARVMGQSGSQQQRGQFGRFVMAVGGAFSKSPESLADFLDILRGDVRDQYPAVDTPTDPELSEAVIKSAEPLDLAVNIANTEAFTRLMWDAYRYAVTREVRPDLTVDQFAQEPTERELGGVTIPNIPNRALIATDPDPVEMIKSYPAAAGFFSSTLDYATGGRIQEVAPALMAGIRKAIAGSRNYESFRNNIRGGVDAFSEDVFIEPPVAESPEQIRDRRLAAFQQAIAEANKPRPEDNALSRLYDWARKNAAKPGVAAFGLDKITATAIKVIMDIASDGPAKTFEEWSANMSEKSKAAVQEFYDTMSKINPDFTIEMAAEAIYAQSNRVLEQPLSGDAAKFLFVNNAEEAARAVYQTADEFLRDQVASIILGSAELVPENYRVLIADLDRKYDKNTPLPAWLEGTTAQERNAIRKNLKPIESAMNVAGMVREISPEVTAAQPIDLPSDVQSIMAHNFLLRYQQIRKKYGKVVRKQSEHIRELKDLLTAEIADGIERNSVYEAMADDMVKQFNYFLSSTINEQADQSQKTGVENTSAARLSAQVNNLRDSTAVGRLMEAIALNAPDDVLNGTSDDIAAWTQAWGQKNQFVGDQVTDALLTEEVGKNVIGFYEDLPQILRWIKASQGVDEVIDAQRKTVQDWIENNPVSDDSLKEWLEEFRKLLNDNSLLKGAIDAKSRRSRYLTREINAEDTSIGVLENLLKDQTFGMKVDSAAEVTDTSLNNVIKMAETNPVIHIVNPKYPGKHHEISFLPGKLADNDLEITTLIADIEEYLTSPEDFDPVPDFPKQRAYRKHLNLLKVHWKHAEATMRGGLAPDGVVRFKIPKTGVSVSLFGAAPLQALSVFTTNQRQFVRRLAGFWGQQLSHILDRLDDMAKQQQKINNHPVYGLAKQQEALFDAARSHKINVSHNYALFDVYVERILEPIVSSQQTATSTQRKVGDWVNGYQINEKDMHYIRLVQQWESAIRRDAQAGVSDSSVKQLQAIEIMDGDWQRKAVGLDTTMPVRMNADMIQWVKTAWAEARTEEEKRQALSAPGNEDIFRRVVIGYIDDRNKLFTRKSDLNPQYRALSEAWAMGKPIPKTWMDVVEQVANASGARPVAKLEQVSKQLFSEIESVVDAFLKQVNSGDDDFKAHMIDKVMQELSTDEELSEAYQKMTRKMSKQNLKGAVGSLVSAYNHYTKPRGGLVAPSTFYNYVPADSGSLSSIQHGAQQVLNLRLIRAIHQVRNAVKSRLNDHEAKIKELESRWERAQYRTGTISDDLGKQRDNYYSLKKWHNHLTYMLSKSLESVQSELADIGSPARHLWGNGRAIGVGNILSSPIAFVRNVSAMFGAAASMADQLSGRTRRAPLTPWMRIVSGSRIVPAAFLNKVAEEMPSFRSFINRNRAILNPMFLGMVTMMDVYAEAKANAIAANIVTPTNVRDLARARRTNKGRGGVNFKEEIPWAVAAANRIMDLPVIAELAEAWIAYNPNAAFDRMSNSFNYNYYNNILEDHVKLSLLTALKTRESAGSKISETMDLLSATEMGYTNERTLSETRLFLQPVGSLEAVAADLWKRYKASGEDVSKVTLFSKESDKNAVIQDIVKVVGGTSFESTRFQPAKGGGIEGLVRREIFTFWGWPTNWLSSLTKIVTNAFSSEKKGQGMSGMMKAGIAASMLVPLFLSWILFGGLVQQELGNVLRDIVFNDPPTSPRLGNVLNADADPKKAAQYFAVSAANLFPYVGSAVANLLEVDSVRNIRVRDLASSVPVLNVLSDLQEGAMAIHQTGDVWMPTATFVRRWAPSPVGFVLNRASDLVGGELVGRGPARSIRAAAPTDIELRLRGGSGGPVRQTKFSGIMRRLLASAYSEKPSEVRKYYRQAIAELRSQGKRDPESIVRQSLTARSPIRSAIGRTLTPQEERSIISNMTASQLNRYNQGKKAFRLISRVVGRPIPFGNNRSRL